jgi:hypothetical protein
MERIKFLSCALVFCVCSLTKSPNRSSWYESRSNVRRWAYGVRSQLLLAVAVLYGVWGELSEALTAIFVICVCIFLEILIEYKAKSALSELKY